MKKLIDFIKNKGVKLQIMLVTGLATMVLHIQNTFATSGITKNIDALGKGMQTEGISLLKSGGTIVLVIVGALIGFKQTGLARTMLICFILCFIIALNADSIWSWIVSISGN